MKKFINRNFFWSSLFVEQLSTLGIQHVCISPGSRNTPLSLAFVKNKKLKKFIIVDERSSGFFALGIAKQTKKPVVIVTTSGTAVAELYPAIIEAYQQRVPLIICTADRPSFLRNVGANQTINQENIFRNHIRNFVDLGLPQIIGRRLNSLCKKTVEAIAFCESSNPGPVHFNFPFKKPLEPNSFTEEINFKISDFIKKREVIPKSLKTDNSKDLKDIQKSDKIIIMIGWDDYDSNFYSELIKLTEKKNIPILVDGTSELRFYKNKTPNLIVNHSSLLKLKSYQMLLEADLLIQFGNASTSQSGLKYLDSTKAQKILVNKFGDRKDPSRKSGKIIKENPIEFLKQISKLIGNKKYNYDWFNKIIHTEVKSEELKNKIINKSKFGLEPRITNELLSVIPKNSNLFVSNSTPVRDFDFFASRKNKNIKIIANRGASGIDGIISTASGVASNSKQKTFLMIGDLAFYHNLTALSNLVEYEIPIIIILINNNGGGIFNMLSIAEEKKHFEKVFTTPLNLDYSKFIKGFGGNYSLAKTWKQFEQEMNKAVLAKKFSVIEIKTDSEKSLVLRKDYWTKLEQEV
ncbi:MAG: 2-succinyl-5-enolpyruvyl-6-hydroxy-3-cyclohexene-1-carboxylic-acid synthase [Ignavibacteriae bacterium]|nr:2-succinyl-5-enolpyruvyl-6-hydroxy-3-cyclohexene-1-carboxylic-acid synthase [Ignavibacteriota bacterium]